MRSRVNYVGKGAGRCDTPPRLRVRSPRPPLLSSHAPPGAVPLRPHPAPPPRSLSAPLCVTSSITSRLTTCRPSLSAPGASANSCGRRTPQRWSVDLSLAVIPPLLLYGVTTASSPAVTGAGLPDSPLSMYLSSSSRQLLPTTMKTFSTLLATAACLASVQAGGQINQYVDPCNPQECQDWPCNIGHHTGENTLTGTFDLPSPNPSWCTCFDAQISYPLCPEEDSITCDCSIPCAPGQQFC